MTESTITVVDHTEEHETIDCPDCGDALCAVYPAPWEIDPDLLVACLNTWYVTGTTHSCESDS